MAEFASRRERDRSVITPMRWSTEDWKALPSLAAAASAPNSPPILSMEDETEPMLPTISSMEAEASVTLRLCSATSPSSASMSEAICSTAFEDSPTLRDWNSARSRMPSIRSDIFATADAVPSELSSSSSPTPESWAWADLRLSTTPASLVTRRLSSAPRRPISVFSPSSPRETRSVRSSDSTIRLVAFLMSPMLDTMLLSTRRMIRKAKRALSAEAARAMRSFRR